MNNILIAEDEHLIARLIEMTLTRAGYTCTVAEDGRTAADLIEKNNFDMALLDIMLPGLDGYALLESLRPQGVPVIFITAKSAVKDRVLGLRLGADDYITKPFSIEELLARIRSALRKQQAAALPRLSVGPLQMDIARHSVTLEGESIDLTGREFALLQYLMENQSIVLSRDVPMDKVWGYDYPGETNIVDVYIRYLRNKIDEAYGVKLLHTVRGVGYVLREEKREG